MLDSRDLTILGMLQEDADTPVYEIADKVNLSPSACSRRISFLRDEGYIQGIVAVLDRKKLNVSMTIVVVIRAQHSGDWLQRFRDALANIPEILDCHRVTGDLDYIMRIAVDSIERYDQVYRRLISKIEISDVSAYISMETIKETRSLPLDQIRFR